MERFLIELLIKAAEILETADWDKSKKIRVERFREYMSKGQSMDSAGPNRVAFYKDVVARARGVRRSVSIHLMFSNPYWI
jgi:hypothetical protein